MKDRPTTQQIKLKGLWQRARILFLSFVSSDSDECNDSQKPMYTLDHYLAKKMLSRVWPTFSLIFFSLFFSRFWICIRHAAWIWPAKSPPLLDTAMSECLFRVKKKRVRAERERGRCERRVKGENQAGKGETKGKNHPSVMTVNSGRSLF